MIVIERTWNEPNSRGGGKLNKVARKCFADDDLDGVNKFINFAPENHAVFSRVDEWRGVN